MSGTPKYFNNKTNNSPNHNTRDENVWKLSAAPSEVNYKNSMILNK